MIMSVSRLNRVVRHLHQVATEIPDQLGDRELLERFVTHRDEIAFEVLLARHGRMVMGVCQRILHDPVVAEDAFQATFLVLANRAASLARGDQLACWLYGVARRSALRAKVEAAKRRGRETAVVPSQTSPDPLGEITARELSAILDEELSKLGSRYRVPLVLCYFEGQTQDQAARSCGWSRATLVRRLERGRELLKARLVRRGVGLPAALLPLLLSPESVSASLPPLLIRSTIDAALAVVTGHQVPSTAATVLAHGVLKTMFLSRLRNVLASLCLTALIGAGVLAGQMLAVPPDPEEEKTPEDATKTSDPALFGTWAYASIENIGPDGKYRKTTFEDKQEMLRFDGKKCIQQTRDADGKVRIVGKFAITVDAEKNPRRLTLHTKTYSLRAIYEVKGDTLRRCFYSLGEEDGAEVIAWPKGFELDKEDVRKHPTLHVFKRVVK